MAQPEPLFIDSGTHPDEGQARGDGQPAKDLHFARAAGDYTGQAVRREAARGVR